MVFHVLNIFDINLTQVNPNKWQTLLCLLVVIVEYGVGLTSDETMYMYCLQKNGLEKGNVYISCVVGHELHLKLFYSSTKLKEKYFYII